jgi:hypothetical protein
MNRDLLSTPADEQVTYIVIKAGRQGLSMGIVPTRPIRTVKFYSFAGGDYVFSPIVLLGS